ncbi:hypothetical protein [Bartonella apis]|uniref:hypothetical protein n=1 Tax=Bartonella apis TaxID=1686310 RepID=UPI00242AD83A|nr:hypothetical protein [Bartonella apis]
MITAFAKIDEAMLQVIKASKELDNAQFSRGEALARDRLVKAANKLRKAVLSTEKEINDEYARKQRSTDIG